MRITCVKHDISWRLSSPALPTRDYSAHMSVCHRYRARVRAQVRERGARLCLLFLMPVHRYAPLTRAYVVAHESR